MIITLRILQKLVVSCELMGRALVPYYRQVPLQLLSSLGIVESQFLAYSIYMDCSFFRRIPLVASICVGKERQRMHWTALDCMR